MEDIASRQQETLEAIHNQLETLENIKSPLSENLPIWRSRTVRFLQDKVIPEEIAAFNDITRGSWEHEAAALRDFLQELSQGIQKVPKQFLLPSKPKAGKQLSEESEPKIPKGKQSVPQIFVIHGHNDALKLDVARTLEKLGLTAVILHEQPNQGRTIIEKLEQHASGTVFAVALLSGDDVGYPKAKTDDAKPRARQNVILELGYFSGLLGRTRVAVLYEDGVEIPSDFLGVVYIPIDKAGSWRFGLAKELKSAGMSIDLNILL